MLDLTGLNQSIAALATEATRTEGTEASAGKVFQNMGNAIKDAVTKALADDAAANAASITAAQQAVDAVTARFVAADDTLGAAIAASPGSAQPAPSAPTP